jgi:rhamnosyltransferase
MNICAIIVTFNPNIAILNQVISSLSNQVNKIYLYKNSDYAFDENSFLSILGNGDNIGIGKAQNLLLKTAIKEGYEYALMSDQDTIYPKDFCNEMITVFPNDKFTIALAPGWSNKNSSINYNGFHVIIRNSLQHDTNSKKLIKISHCISSGMLIKLNFINKVGFFCENLFIDWIDNEWCWRINNKGFNIYGNPNIIIDHNLGDKNISYFNIRFTKRSTLRNYYIIRNAVYLFVYTDYKLYKFYLFKKIIQHFILSIIFSDKKIKEITILFKSIKDGIFKKLGKANFNIFTIF